MPQVTGVCECVGMTSPMLGGSHGLLQGQHGLLADHFIEARIILANSTTLTASKRPHPDLFWAIRGAGRNFGIATEYKYKIFDLMAKSTWADESFTFTGDKLEALYTLTNLIDAVKPVILYYVPYDGPAKDERKYSALIHALDPMDAQQDEVPYTRLPKATGNSNDALACQTGAVAICSPIDLKSYNVTALRLVYDEFTDITQRIPAFNSSFFLLEGCFVQAVQGIPGTETTFPHRADTLLLSPVVYYQPNGTLDAQAIKFGKAVIEILRIGSGSSEQHSYVNYAHGDESLESMYGYELWRFEKLQILKRQYDMHGKFDFHALIA